MGVKVQIIIEIDQDDNIKLETKGFKGPSCEAELKEITEGICEVKSKKRTSEYYEKAKSTVKKKISRFSK